MSTAIAARHSEVTGSGGVRLALRETGPDSGQTLIALHGLLGTRDAVIAGTAFEQAGVRVCAYDFRGHGQSGAPPDPTDYGYDALTADLVSVLDAVGADRPILIGISMGGLTAVRLALDHPERVAGMILVTPAFQPGVYPVDGDLDRAAPVADALRRADVDAFLAANPVPLADPAAAPVLRRIAEQQFASHRNLGTVADALEAILAARPFESLEPLAAIDVPVLVVGSHDELDRNHPLRVARAYADAIPGANFTSEPEGRLPLAWRGRQLARVALDFTRDAGLL